MDRLRGVGGGVGGAGRGEGSRGGRLLRLDAFVNRVSYDRMIDALQLFLQPTAVAAAGGVVVPGMEGAYAGQ